jgi:hypothetical protein
VCTALRPLRLLNISALGIVYKDRNSKMMVRGIPQEGCYMVTGNDHDDIDNNNIVKNICLPLS